MSSQWPPSFRYAPFGLQIGAPQRSWGKHHLLIQLGGQKWHHLSDRVHEPIMNQSLEIPFLSAEANSKFRLSGWAHFNQHCLLTWVAWCLTLQSSISLHREVHNKTCKKHEDHHSKCQNTAFVCFRDVRDPWKNPWHLLKIWGFCRCQAPLSTSHLEGHHGSSFHSQKSSVIFRGNDPMKSHA